MLWNTRGHSLRRTWMNSNTHVSIMVIKSLSKQDLTQGDSIELVDRIQSIPLISIHLHPHIVQLDTEPIDEIRQIYL